MTYTTQPIARRPMPMPQFMMMMLAALVLVFVMSSSARAQWTNTTPNINNTNTGNVGVGTSNPTEKLEVNGTVKSGGLTITGAPSEPSYVNALYLGMNGTTATIDAVNQMVDFRDLVITDKTFHVRSWNGGGFVTGLFQNNAGNVGIGTTTPGEFVHVRKDQNAETHLMVENATAGASAYADLKVKNNLGHFAQFGLYSSSTTTAGALASGNAFAYTTSPAMVIMANNGTGIIKFATGGLSERMRIDAAGNVGIGTTTPSDLMQVDTASGWGLRIRYTGDGQYLRLSSNQLSSFTSAGAGRDLYLNPAGGNVGIGTATPNSNYKLDVNGALNASGAITGSSINAKYQDMAEWVHSSQQLSAGTVVVLDHTKSNQVIASSKAYDTRVAGVISLQPGITLGEDGAGKVLVATTGRVKVKVDATAGPIQVGDLLVTSDKEGIAKKSEPLNLGGVAIHRPGTLIGKALEPLAGGTGEILVLLSLQ